MILVSVLIQQNLASWNPSNPECLLLVVKELVQQYHQFQCSRLRESSRLMFEYQTLLEEPQYGENMEIYAGKKNNWVSVWSISAEMLVVKLLPWMENTSCVCGSPCFVIPVEKTCV